MSYEHIWRTNSPNSSREIVGGLGVGALLFSLRAFFAFLPIFLRVKMQCPVDDLQSELYFCLCKGAQTPLLIFMSLLAEQTETACADVCVLFIVAHNFVCVKCRK